VVLAENHFYGGNKVVLDHGGGLFTAYSHMSEIKVRLEDVVEKGSLIGFSGMTGRVTGPHLHWEVFLNGNRINPELLIDLEYAQD
jgi:murein DD-endopeptidase MepM/ murein hydrolase activator NlpD